MKLYSLALALALVAAPPPPVASPAPDVGPPAFPALTFDRHDTPLQSTYPASVLAIGRPKVLALASIADGWKSPHIAAPIDSGPPGSLGTNLDATALPDCLMCYDAMAGDASRPRYDFHDIASAISVHRTNAPPNSTGASELYPLRR